MRYQRNLVPVCGTLLLVVTGIGLIMTPGVVGADWPRLVWSAYHVGPAIVIAVLPLLSLLVLAAVVLVYSWPQAATRALLDVAQRNGWRLLDPRELELAALPLPGGLSRSDITLESAGFYRSFDVIGNDARYLTAVLHPRTMQAVLDARPVSRPSLTG